MVVKQTIFNKAGFTFNVITKKIQNGFLISCEGKQDVFRENMVDALNVHEDFEEELADKKREEIQTRKSRAEESLEKAKEAEQNFESWLRDARVESEKSLEKYEEKQSIVNE